jgi:hypothetical protein
MAGAAEQGDAAGELGRTEGAAHTFFAMERTWNEMVPGDVDLVASAKLARGHAAFSVARGKRGLRAVKGSG